jgi:CRP-like cAMP-binding protein
VPQSPPPNPALKTLEHLGNGMQSIDELRAMMVRTHFMDDTRPEEVERLAGFLQIYRAQAGEAIIREGDCDDYMLVIISGRVDIMKTDRRGIAQPMTSAGPGAALGEMSMIDGEPRFASCVAAERTTFATLSREDMVRIIMEVPALGAKLLIKLVTLLSARLRQTSATLLHYMER